VEEQMELVVEAGSPQGAAAQRRWWTSNEEEKNLTINFKK